MLQSKRGCVACSHFLKLRSLKFSWRESESPRVLLHFDDGILEKLTFTVYHSRTSTTDNAKEASNYLNLVNFCQTRIIMDSKGTYAWVARIMLHALDPNAI